MGPPSAAGNFLDSQSWSPWLRCGVWSVHQESGSRLNNDTRHKSRRCQILATSSINPNPNSLLIIMRCGISDIALR
jgi:hypothetical protein